MYTFKIKKKLCMVAECIFFNFFFLSSVRNELKDCEFLFQVLSNCVNESIENGIFPDSLKEVTLLQCINPKIGLKD